LEAAGEQFSFRQGESIQLFFSYRYTPDLVRALLSQHGLEVERQWITKSQQEGVFLVCRDQTRIKATPAAARQSEAA
jgi:uncharacterized SAM-dependent methyltransferase